MTIFSLQIPVCLELGFLIDLKVINFIIPLYREKLFQNYFMNLEFRILFNKNIVRKKLPNRKD